MKSKAKRIEGSNGQSGQVLPWLAIMMMLFMGITAFVVDVGRGVVAYHALQAATDAAAMAGAQALPTATSSSAVSSVATLYSAVAGNKNANSGILPNTTMVTGYPKIWCSSTVTADGVPCNPAVNANAIAVSETATIPTYFAQFIGIRNLTVNAYAAASMQGAQNAPYNVAVIVDTTASMNSSDTSGGCTSTRIACAEGGLQALLNALTPCTSTSTTTGPCTGFDSVSLFTYPNIPANQASDDTQCNSANPSSTAYSTPAPGGTWTPTSWTSSSPTYQVADYSSGWTQNNQKGGSLAAGSGLVIAAGASTTRNCPGMAAVGGQGTYYAGAIYAALASLAYQQANNPIPGSKNALIILSDGDANATTGHMTATNGQTLQSNGTYPSLKDQCHQAITAAQTARTMTDAQGNLDTTV
ncbi:MAG: pilus assembly protein TadG-related protein, partial [Terracidiphilus sp.]